MPRLIPSDLVAVPLSLTFLILGLSRFSPILTPSLYASRVAFAPTLSPTHPDLARKVIGGIDVVLGLGVLLRGTSRRWTSVAVLVFNGVGVVKLAMGEDVGMSAVTVVGIMVAAAVARVLC
ncbi:hypothetical protein MNV49_005773 [Pseudohyphozyma bogoriensis]|nr:hypothetical protein MNV49_005773 [Pseudohyphozyma bogoriensis]